MKHNASDNPDGWVKGIAMLIGCPQVAGLVHPFEMDGRDFIRQMAGGAKPGFLQQAGATLSPPLSHHCGVLSVVLRDPGRLQIPAVWPLTL